jgi:nickel transport system substrate-binding protein
MKRTAGPALLLLLGTALAGGDPRKEEVVLPAEGGWHAQLVLDRGTVGIWTVGAFPIFDSVGTEEVVALDDEGRCTVLIPYSGRWTPMETIQEGSWLGGLAHGDLDPSVPGKELYTGGKRGDLWQIVAHPHGALESRLVTHFPGEEIHTLVIDDLDPRTPGNEMLAFTWPGGLYVVTGGGPKLAVRRVQALDTRIRDAVVLPHEEGTAPEVAVVSRAGRLETLRLEGEGAKWTEIDRQRTGMGRVALREEEDAIILYTVCDDGRVYRYERRSDGWRTPQLIYAGPLGARGVVTGRFGKDPDQETIAVFGYSGCVEILAKEPAGWTRTTVFRDRDKGHWLATIEADGRNATDEILCCGYSGRLSMLYRPPGYGLDGVLATEAPGDGAPLRIGVVGMRRAEPTITPLVYHGGFTVKSLVFETLVRTDDEGRLVPGLAASWERSEGGRRWTFELRPGVRFHDGRPCDAAAVKAHFDGWIGKPEHAWLGMSSRVEHIETPGPTRLDFVMKEPYPLPRDLAATNPCAVTAGGPETSVGSGPFRVERHDPGVATLLAHVDSGSRIEIRPLDGGDHTVLSPIAVLRAGQVDAVVDGWVPQIPREEARDLGAGDEFRVQTSPGSLTVFLEPNREAGPFRDRDARLRLAAAIDREALVKEVAAGYAEPRETLFAVPLWPARRVAPPAPAPPAPPITARFLVHDLDPDHVRLALSVARQARRAGIEIDVVAVPRPEYVKRRGNGDYDIAVSTTHGLPYDPHMWLVSRFLGAEAESGMAALVRATFDAEGDGLAARYADIEARIEAEAFLIPLFAPHRLALARRGVEGIRFGRNGYEIDLAAARVAR